MKKRIEWIDFIKGIMIVCVIFGHTFPVDSIIRNIIFSFHMPLFFALSGYTFKEISKKDTFKSFVKDIRRLILPAISTLLIWGCIVVRKSDTFMLDLLWFVLLRLFWGNGSDFNYLGHQLYGVGPVWFLLALFVAKMIYRVLFRVQSEYRQIFILLGTWLGVILGNYTIVLPWNLDFIFIALAFMELGFLINKYEERFLKYIHIISILCFLAWSVLIYPYDFLAIEMAARMYPLGMLSIVEASFACVSILYIGKMICNMRGGGYYWKIRNVFIRFVVYTWNRNVYN